MSCWRGRGRGDFGDVWYAWIKHSRRAPPLSPFPSPYSPLSEVQQTVVDMQWHKITQNAIVLYSGKLTSVARWRRHSVQLVPQTLQGQGGGQRAGLAWLKLKNFSQLVQVFWILVFFAFPSPSHCAALCNLYEGIHCSTAGAQTGHAQPGEMHMPWWTPDWLARSLSLFAGSHSAYTWRTLESNGAEDKPSAVMAINLL